MMQKLRQVDAERKKKLEVCDADKDYTPNQPVKKEDGLARRPTRAIKQASEFLINVVFVWNSL